VKTAHLKFIFITIFIDMLGIGLIIPILPELIRHFVADPKDANQYFGYFISIYAFIQFFASPALGALSDRYGRRPVLLVSLLGAAIDYIVMAFSPTILILFIGRVIAGLSGASLTVASAYIADISDEKNRSANFGMIGAAFGLGFIVGPALGGLIGSYGWRYPFLAAAFLNFCNFLFGYFVLPESIKNGARRKIELKNLNPISSLTKILKSTDRHILGLIFIYTLLVFSNQVHPSNWTLYTQLKFGWSTRDVGLSLSVVGLSIAIVQGGLTRIIIPRLGEWRSVIIGALINALGFLLFAVASQGWMMFAILVPGALAGIAGPALQSLITSNTPSNEQGELQGTLTSLSSLAAILGPVLFTALFAYSTTSTHFYFAGSAYMLAAAVSFLAAAILFRINLSRK
jgi:DHA1 family tetracycline resistance protein-like MFS transporter